MISAGMTEGVERYYVVPHTHWDREWYRPLEHFRLMLGEVVDEVLDTLEGDPALTSFTLDGQAIVLEDYVEVRPENEARLRESERVQETERVRDGERVPDAEHGR